MIHILTGKIKDRFQSHQQHPSITSTGTSTTPNATTEETIYRYRKQRGVNVGVIYVLVYQPNFYSHVTHIRHLGSWFILDRWISYIPFRSADALGRL